MERGNHNQACVIATSMMYPHYCCTECLWGLSLKKDGFGIATHCLSTLPWFYCRSGHAIVSSDVGFIAGLGMQ